MTYTNTSGIVYHPSRGTIARARLRRAFRLRFANLRAALSSLYASHFTPFV